LSTQGPRGTRHSNPKRIKEGFVKEMTPELILDEREVTELRQAL
jgi:hypothetical protein